MPKNEREYSVDLRKKTSQLEMPGEKIDLITPQSTKSIRLSYTSEQVGIGCQGYVQPAVIIEHGRQFPVQIKKFFTDVVDDSPEGGIYKQDPQEMVEKSYEAFQILQAKGFKIVPFYGVAIDQEGEKSLVMTDLGQEGTREVYDEKDLQRGRTIMQVIDGKEHPMNAQDAVDNLANRNNVGLDFLHNAILNEAYKFQFGFGVAHMVVRDPQTNTGEAFLTDVGEFGQTSNKYREVIPFDELVEVPEQEIIETFTHLLKQHHPKADAQDLFKKYKARGRKNEFQDLYYKATVGICLETGTVFSSEIAFARKRFARNSQQDSVMQAKLALDQIEKSYQKLTGEPLWDITQESHDQFVAGSTDTDLIKGIDFAYLAVIDARMQQLFRMRKAIDTNEEPSLQKFPIIFKDGFPEMQIIDNYNEITDDTYTVNIQKQNITLSAEFDWEKGYEIAGGNKGEEIFVLPEQIKEVTIDGQVVSDFNPDDVQVRNFQNTPLIQKDDIIYYLHDGTVIYEAPVKEDDEVTKIQSIIDKQQDNN